MAATISIEDRDGEQIADLSAWKKLASKGAGERWKKGGSAQQLAESWLTGAGPGALRLALDKHEATKDFTIKKGVAGAQLDFDDFGGGRGVDLLLSGEAEQGSTIVAVEGRIDDGFGQTLEEYKNAYTRKIANKENTNAPARLKNLTMAVAGWEVADNASRLKLRMQLFTGAAATLAAAAEAQAEQAIYCVHEIETDKADAKKRAQNDDDLRDFLHTVFGLHAPTDTKGWVVGPAYATPHSDRIPSTIPLYVAKLRT